MAEFDRTPKRVLVTGSSGVIGGMTARELARRGHVVRGFDLREPDAPLEGVDDIRVGDLADEQTVFDAAAGMEMIVHIGGVPREADFKTQLLPSNILGTHHVFEAALKHGARRVIATSTCMVMTGHDFRTRVVGVDAPLRPTGLYAASKVALEGMAYSYHQQHKLPVIVVRPGWAARSHRCLRGMEESAVGKSMYLSWEDAGRFFADCVEVAGVTFATVYAQSEGDETMGFDRQAARDLLAWRGLHRWPEGLPDPATLPEKG